MKFVADIAMFILLMKVILSFAQFKFHYSNLLSAVIHYCDPDYLVENTDEERDVYIEGEELIVPIINHPIEWSVAKGAAPPEDILAEELEGKCFCFKNPIFTSFSKGLNIAIEDPINNEEHQLEQPVVNEEEHLEEQIVGEEEEQLEEAVDPGFQAFLNLIMNPPFFQRDIVVLRGRRMPKYDMFDGLTYCTSYRKYIDYTRYPTHHKTCKKWYLSKLRYNF